MCPHACITCQHVPCHQTHPRILCPVTKHTLTYCVLSPNTPSHTVSCHQTHPHILCPVTKHTLTYCVLSPNTPSHTVSCHQTHPHILCPVTKHTLTYCVLSQTHAHILCPVTKHTLTYCVLSPNTPSHTMSCHQTHPHILCPVTNTCSHTMSCHQTHPHILCPVTKHTLTYCVLSPNTPSHTVSPISCFQYDHGLLFFSVHTRREEARIQCNVAYKIASHVLLLQGISDLTDTK